MTNDYYNATGQVARQSLSRSAEENADRQAVKAGFDLLPPKDKLNQGRVTYITDTGSADVYAAAMSPTLTSYQEGIKVRVKISNTNTGASTLNIDGLGARAIKRMDGTDVEVTDLTAGDIHDFTFDGTNFVLLTPSRTHLNGAAALFSSLLSHLATLGTSTAAGQFLVSTAAGVFAWQKDTTLRQTLGLHRTGRAALKTYLLTNPIYADGEVVWADGLGYVKETGATEIADIPDWRPFGSASPGHHGDLDTPANTRAAFENAMNSGVPVYVRAESYQFDGPATTTSGTSPRIRGVKGATSIKLQDAATGDLGLFKITAPGGGYIRDLFLDGNRYNQIDGHHSTSIQDAAIWVNGGDEFEVEGTKILRANAQSLRMLNTTRQYETRNHFEDGGYNLVLLGPGGTAQEVEEVVSRGSTYVWKDSDPFTGGGTARGGSTTTIQLKAPQTFDAATAISGNQITITGHGYSDNDLLKYDANGGTVIGGLTDGEAYWVNLVGPNTIELAALRNGTPIALTAGTGTQQLFEHAAVGSAVIALGGSEITFDAATGVSGETITSTAHGLKQCDRVIYYAKGNTAVGGLEEYDPQNGDEPEDLPVYFVDKVDADNIRLRAGGPEGELIALTASTGTHALVEAQETSARVTAFDTATQTITIEGNWDTGSLTVGSATRYLLRQGISDRTALFIGQSTSDPDAKLVKKATIADINIHHEKLFASGYAAGIESKNVRNMNITGGNITGGGMGMSIAQATKKVTVDGLMIDMRHGLYGVEIADQTDEVSVRVNFDGHWGVDAGVQLNGGASGVNIQSNILGTRKAAVRSRPTEHGNGTVAAVSGDARTITLAATGEIYADYWLFIKRASDSSVERNQIISYDEGTPSVTVKNDWTGADPTTSDEYWVQPVSTGVSVSGGNLSSLGPVIDFDFAEDISVSGGEHTSFDPTKTYQLSDCRKISWGGMSVRAPEASYLFRVSSSDDLIGLEDAMFYNMQNPALGAVDRYIFLVSSPPTNGNIKFLGNANGYDWTDYENNILRGSGTGSPEGVVTAGISSEWSRTDGGTGTAKYLKETGTGNTGWVAI
jgi:hypothetical protein